MKKRFMNCEGYLNNIHFEIDNDEINFYIGGYFMTSTTLSELSDKALYELGIDRNGNELPDIVRI